METISSLWHEMLEQSIIVNWVLWRIGYHLLNYCIAGVDEGFLIGRGSSDEHASPPQSLQCPPCSLQWRHCGMSHPDAQKCRMPRPMEEVGSCRSLLSKLIGFVLWDRWVSTFSLSVSCEWCVMGCVGPGLFRCKRFWCWWSSEGNPLPHGHAETSNPSLCLPIG